MRSYVVKFALASAIVAVAYLSCRFVGQRVTMPVTTPPWILKPVMWFAAYAWLFVAALAIAAVWQAL